jgi:ABC-type uncharacterized transport system permease subunit
MDLASALLQSAVAMAVPLLLAGLGELLAERGGVINVGLEGMILVGAFAAMLTTHHSGSVLLGAASGVVSGVALALVFGLAAIVQNANQVVTGVALNLLAVGLTGVAYRGAFGVTGAALTIPGLSPIHIPLLSDLPIVGKALFTQTALAYLAFGLVPVCALFVTHTVPGLQLRMVGENPHAAAAQGVAVVRVRMWAMLACGAFAGLAGAHLVLVYARTFVEGMSAGRGFIALAIVIFGRWSPVGISGAALLFGLATALQFHLQALGLPVPYQFSLMVPYVTTLLVLALSGRKAHAPAALGQPYLHE